LRIGRAFRQNVDDQSYRCGENVLRESLNAVDSDRLAELRLQRLKVGFRLFAGRQPQEFVRSHRRRPLSQGKTVYTKPWLGLRIRLQI
jgi:hypothetical protein